MRWLVAVVLACGSPPPPPPRPPPPPAPAELPDVAEPEQPADECSYTRIVTCEPSATTGQAALAGTDPGAVGKHRHLSVSESRTARAEHPDACCYVEFVRGVCL